MAKVLIVDDSPTEVHVLKGVLEKGGHNVSSADNAEDGIKQAKAVKPDVILMDVVMPVNVKGTSMVIRIRVRMI